MRPVKGPWARRRGRRSGGGDVVMPPRSWAPRRTRRGRGFALLVVVLVLAVLSAAVAVTLEESVDTIRSSGLARSRELVRSGLEHGLHLGVSQVQQMDAATLESPANDWDIFDAEHAIPVDLGRDFIGPFVYPPAGPYTGQYRVRVGLRPALRTRAPPGEDVRHAYGQIVEVQVGVEAQAVGMPPAEERVSVGVLLPRSVSHAN